jgi:hypothetical protein
MDEATFLNTTKFLSGSLGVFLLLAEALVDAYLVGNFLITAFKDLLFAGDTKFESFAIRFLYFNEIINKMAGHTLIIP